MAATTRRHAPVPPRVALRALAAAVVALVVGGWLMFVVVVVAIGGDLTTGSAWWLVLAGGAACGSGVVVGYGGQATPAAVIAVIAIACLVLADAAAQQQRRGGVGQAALAARGLPEDAAPLAETGRSRGNAGAEPGAEPGAKPGAKAGDASRPAAKADEIAPPAAKAGEIAPPITSGRATAPPTAATGTLDAAAASGVVTSYYAALDRHEYAIAWARLAPAVQAAFGGFVTWRTGYATTLGHRVEDVAVQPDGSVRHVLVATDRTPCGGRTEQRFAMTWRLTGAGPDWRATALTAVKLAGADPAAAC